MWCSHFSVPNESPHGRLMTMPTDSNRPGIFGRGRLNYRGVRNEHASQLISKGRTRSTFSPGIDIEEPEG